MVDKELNFVVKNNTYGYLKETNQQYGKIHKLTYSDGSHLKYGDPAEIFSAVTSGIELLAFMESAISETYFTREHYGFTFGYQPADYGQDDEIKENEVGVHYAGVDNTITKKEFYELCLLLCDAKLNGLDMQEDTEVSKKDLLQMKTQLEEKIKSYNV